MNSYCILIPSLSILLLTIFLVFNRKQQKETKLPSHCKKMADLLNEELKPAGFAYDTEQDIFYSLMDCWQRDFGYCRLYDEAAAALSMIIDCEPIYFEYKGRNWMIEFWKGQYGMNTGAEIGIYVSDSPEITIKDYFNGTFYESITDDERLSMSFTLRKNEAFLFSRKDIHWWLTGFVLGEYTEPEELTMEIKLTFPNSEMCQAFLMGLEKAGYHSDEIVVRYHTVFLTFDQPHTEQPLSRTPVTEKIMQSNNELYCRLYKHVTRDHSHTLDKLEYLKQNFPVLYENTVRLGQSPKLYESYEILQKYLKDRRD